LKKLTGSVQFWFYKPKTEKPNQTEPNKKPEKTESNRFEPVFSLKIRTEPKPAGLNQFRLGFGCFLKKFNLIIIFFIKTEPNRK
jgi:hypothetical protein